MKNVLLFFLIIVMASCDKPTTQQLFEVEVVTISQIDCKIPVVRFMDTTGMYALANISSTQVMVREIPEALKVTGKHLMVSIKAAPDAVYCTAFGPAPPPLLVLTAVQEKK